MHLMDGFPIPKQKSGALQQLLGFSLFPSPKKNTKINAESTIYSDSLDPDEETDNDVTISASFNSKLSNDLSKVEEPTAFISSVSFSKLSIDEIIIEPYVFF